MGKYFRILIGSVSVVLPRASGISVKWDRVFLAGFTER